MGKNSLINLYTVEIVLIILSGQLVNKNFLQLKDFNRHPDVKNVQWLTKRMEEGIPVIKMINNILRLKEILMIRN